MGSDCRWGPLKKGPNFQFSTKLETKSCVIKQKEQFDTLQLMLSLMLLIYSSTRFIDCYAGVSYLESSWSQQQTNVIGL